MKFIENKNLFSFKKDLTVEEFYEVIHDDFSEIVINEEYYSWYHNDDVFKCEEFLNIKGVSTLDYKPKAEFKFSLKETVNRHPHGYELIDTNGNEHFVQVFKAELIKV